MIVNFLGRNFSVIVEKYQPYVPAQLDGDPEDCDPAQDGILEWSFEDRETMVKFDYYSIIDYFYEQFEDAILRQLGENNEI